MTEQVERDKVPRKTSPEADDQSVVQRLLEEHRRRSTSGLSWDEVAEQTRKDWRRITEMGEGD
jgi:hypothetical protein